MTEKPTGWTLWSRSGYRGPANLKPGSRASRAAEQAAPALRDEVPRTTQPPGGGSHAAPALQRRGSGGAVDPLESLVGQIIADRSVHIEYQAIHDVERGQVVAFEALSRGPAGPLRSPALLFAAAHAVGQAGELDWVCRAAAFRGMLEAGLPPSISLFVNTEPDSLIEPCPADLLDIVVEAERKLRVFIDLSGRSIGRHPGEVLETARRARAASWGVVINDIETSSAGASLLPTLEPDVVKLNHNLIASGLGQVNSAMMAAIAECERSGAALLVERVEDHGAAMIARAAGAAYQQGYLLSKEGPLPTTVPQPLAPVPLLRHDAITAPQTPWEALERGGARRTTHVSQAGLDHLTMVAATQATTVDQLPVVAAVMPTGLAVPAARQTMFSILLERCPLIVIVGEGASAFGDWRVRAADLPSGHPLTHETCLLMLSPAIAMVVAARRQGSAHDTSPLWDLMVSQNPELCRAVMRNLLATVDMLAGGARSYD